MLLHTLRRASIAALIVVAGCAPPPRPQVPRLPIPGTTQGYVGYVLIDKPEGTECSPGSGLQLRASVWEHGEWSRAVVSWKSDKTTVATVNSSGRVVCVAAGRAVITAVTPAGWRDRAVIVVGSAPKR